MIRGWMDCVESESSRNMLESIYKWLPGTDYKIIIEYNNSNMLKRTIEVDESLISNKNTEFIAEEEFFVKYQNIMVNVLINDMIKS